MDLESLFRHPAFNGLLPGQMQLFRQFASDIQGKTGTEIAKLYMQLNQKISQIAPLSQAQRSAIIQAVQGFLPEGDRAKLTGFLRMMGR